MYQSGCSIVDFTKNWKQLTGKSLTNSMRSQGLRRLSVSFLACFNCFVRDLLAIGMESFGCSLSHLFSKNSKILNWMRAMQTGSSTEGQNWSFKIIHSWLQMYFAQKLDCLSRLKKNSERWMLQQR